MLSGNIKIGESNVSKRIIPNKIVSVNKVFVPLISSFKNTNIEREIKNINNGVSKPPTVHNNTEDDNKIEIIKNIFMYFGIKQT